MQRREYDLTLIGKNLRKLREKKHLSVEEVRQYLCLGSVQAIYKYEQGKGYPQVDTMFALMELYGATLKDIVTEHEEGGSPPSSPFVGNKYETLRLMTNQNSYVRLDLRKMVTA